MLRFRCSSCSRGLRVSDDLAGQSVLCPKCHAVVEAPALRPAVAAVSQSVPSDPDTVEEHAGTPALARPPQKIDPEDLIDMTAMVDIVFFLLIFFLVTSMAGLNSSMHLPNPESRAEEGGGPGPKALDQVEADGDDIIVQINRDDSLEVDGIQVPDIPALLIRLQQLRGAAGGRSGLLIVGNGNATHGTTVAVLDTAYEAGMEKVRLAIQTDQPD